MILAETSTGVQGDIRCKVFKGSQFKMMQTEDLNVRQNGPGKLDIEMKSDWLLICSFS